MKKFLFIAASAALLLTACVKVENHQVTKETPVTFGVYTGKIATKAVSATDFGDITTNSLGKSTNAGFGVFGFFSDNSAGSNDFVTSPSSNFTPNFMYNQNVKGNGDGSAAATAWTYSPIKYWPNEYSTSAALSAQVDKLTFFAYAPYVSSTAAAAADEGILSFSANNATGDPTVSFKVPAADDEQIDLLWADASVSPTINLTKQELDGNVSFYFKHALSNLSLYPVAVIDASSIPASTGNDVLDGDGNSNPDATITVNSITISGTFNQSGTLNLRTGAWTSTPAASAQTVTYTPATPLDVTDINDKAEADAGDPCAEFMFIPSSAGAKTYTVTIDYDVTYEDAALASALVVKNVIHKDISLDFEQGKKMKLYIGLGMTSVVFTAVVADWTADDPATIWLPVNTD